MANETLAHGDGVAKRRVRELSLSVAEGPDKGKTAVVAAERVSIGSHPSCDVVLTDPTVSRFHCELVLEGDRVRLRDLGSRNGTMLDQVAITDAFVRDKSRVRVGATALQLDFGLQTQEVAVSGAQRFGSLHGVSAMMRHMFLLLERAAQSDATVLIEGETGTGKTAAARSLHQKSKRQSGPFVVFDCGAVPATLMESELFGHEKGAFTGADKRRIGAFEEAHGGTLFIDEIGELPLNLQPKLLGVLENRELKRLGGNGTVSVDVRIVAATHRDLRAEVNAARFRSDLYYRLAVVRVAQPALRERPEDIEVMARVILAELGAGPARVDALCTQELLAELRAHRWPGNVRELRNFLERYLVLDELSPLADPAAGDVAPTGPLSYADAKQRALDVFEKEYLTRLLARHDNKVSAAAAEADIDRTYFYRLLRRHGLSA